MTTLMLPIAGRSTRFGELGHKFKLTAPDGLSMLAHGLTSFSYDSVERVVIVSVEPYFDSKGEQERLLTQVKEVTGVSTEIILLPQPTRCQAETVIIAIKQLEIKDHFIVKDCDMKASGSLLLGNWVGVVDIRSQGSIAAASKSYSDVSSVGTITRVIEKSVISNFFNCGLYSFSSGATFLSAYDEIKDYLEGEIYISHVIMQMISLGEVFEANYFKDFFDFGTEMDWHTYRNNAGSYFIDLDGVVFKNAGYLRQGHWGQTILEENVNTLKKLQQNPMVRIIFTTSRPESERQASLHALRELGIHVNESDIIMALPHAKRVLINDFAPTNPFPSAIAINIQRDSDNLSAYLRSAL